MIGSNKLHLRLGAIVRSSNFWWLLVGVFSISRIATWLFPFDSDHWIFFYVGKHWFNGKELYLEVWDHKSPLIFALNGIMSKLIGDNLILHRVLLTVVTVLSVWLFYLVAQQVFAVLQRKSAVLDARIASLAFAFWINLSQFTNSGNDTEAFGVLALLVAVYCYFKFRTSGKYKWLLYSGVGVSFLVFLKVNFALLLVPLIIDFLVNYWRKWQKIIYFSAIWITPLIIQFIAWYSYFAPRKLFGEFWIATIGFNSKYAKVGWQGGLSSNLKSFLFILGIAGLFFVSTYWLVWRKRKNEKSGLLLLFGGVVLLFSVASGTFYSHYFLIVIPYLCILFAAYWRELLSSKLFLAIALFGALGSYLISIKQLYNTFNGSVAEDARNMKAAADFVNSHTEQNDTIIFDGYGATFYQLAQRDSGSRFISASHPLIDSRENFGYDLTKKYIGDMAVSRPKYVIVDLATADIYSKNTEAVKYFSNHYYMETKLPGYEIWRRGDD